MKTVLTFLFGALPLLFSSIGFAAPESEGGECDGISDYSAEVIHSAM